MGDDSLCYYRLKFSLHSLTEGQQDLPGHVNGERSPVLPNVDSHRLSRFALADVVSRLEHQHVAAFLQEIHASLNRQCGVSDRKWWCALRIVRLLDNMLREAVRN